MRASVYEGSRIFRTAPATRPTRAQDQALLRVLRAGICGTDLHIFQGHLDHRVPRGGTIGHETLADVAEAPSASGFTAGDRVVVEPLRVCGTCRACRSGVAYLCYSLKVLGVDEPGGMQEYWTVATDRLLRVPAALADDQAALIEPLAVATHDVRRAGVKAGDRVVVVGGGPIGALISMVARHRAEPLPVDLYRFFARELTLHGSRLYAREDWEEALRLAAAGAVTLAPLVSRRIPLESLQQGMEEALRGGPVMKVLIDLAG